ncbi:MAG: glycosyl hydrolase family 28-related protein [Promethearchaeota archaeon]
MPFINVRDYGAMGDTITDDTLAFQQALQTASQSDGGIVIVPRGDYRINGTLIIPANVTLSGVFVAPTTCGLNEPFPPKNIYKGTTLLAYSGRGNVDATPFITLQGHNSTLKGLTIYYPEQDDPQNIVPYPWTIRGGNPESITDNLTIKNVMLLNPYLAVDFARYKCGRHLIQGLYGQPLRSGIEIDKCHDIGRIENVHFWPFWSLDATKQFTATNGFSLVLRRSDWQIVHNFFSFGYHVGILFGHGYDGEGPNGQFTNLNLDAVNVGLDIYAISKAGIQISNLNIAAANESDFGQTIRCAVLTHSDIPDDNVDGDVCKIASLSIVNASFWGYLKTVIDWKMGNMFKIANSSFIEWEQENTAIYINYGSVIIQGNHFKNRIGRAIYLGRGTDRAIVNGNQLSYNTIKSRMVKRHIVIKNNLK